MRNRTLPGKYMVGSWQSLAASDAQRIISEEVISTQRMMVVRCAYREGSDFEAHVHAKEQVTIVESGKLAFVINGSTVQVGEGEMISIFPGVLHATRVVGDQSARALNIFYSGSEVQNSARTGKQSKYPEAEAI